MASPVKTERIQVNVLLEPDMFRTLVDHCEVNDITRSQFIRSLIRQWIAEHEVTDA